MAHKHLFKIKELNSTQLIDLLINKGYKDVANILNSRNLLLNGREILELTEVQLLRWKLSTSDRKKFWSCLMEMKSDPKKFLLECEKNSVSIERKCNFKQQDIKIKEQSEEVIEGKLTKVDDIKTIKPRVKTPPLDGYIAMEKQLNSTDIMEDHIDDYLIPIAQPIDVANKEPNYESPPVSRKIILPPLEEDSPPPSLPKFIPSEHRNISITSLDQPQLLVNNSHENNEENLYEPEPAPESNTQHSHSSESNCKFKIEQKSPDMDKESSFLHKNYSHRPLPPLPSNLDMKQSKLVVTEIKKYLNLPNQEEPSINIYGNEETNTFGYTNKPDEDKINVENKTNHPKRYELFSRIEFQNKLPSPPKIVPKFPLKKDASEDQEYEQFTGINFNNEPFYRNTDRKGARRLLEDLEDGAFLFRPSIETTDSNRIRLNTDSKSVSPEFSTINECISYFSRNVLTFKHENTIVEILLKKVLPVDKF